MLRHTAAAAAAAAAVCRLMLLLLLLLIAGVLGQQQQQQQAASLFAVQPANLKGETLILDVGSLKFQGNHPMFPSYDRAGCEDACLRTPGCNSYTFCEAKEGCGSGCRAFVEQHPQLRTAAGGNPTLPDPAWRSLASISAFGPWGVTAGCKSECDGSGNCKPGDRFPYGMCSLKRVADPSRPQCWSSSAAEGWVSGVRQPPAACAALPVTARACARCLSSKNAGGCLKCASSAALRLPLLDSAVAVGPLAAADGCAACFNSTQPDKCVACLQGGAGGAYPCAACALQAPDSDGRLPDVGACLDCMAQRGPRFKDACIACAVLGGAPQQQQAQAQMRGCMSCLGDMAAAACDNAEYQAPCWNPATQPRVCADCAASASSFSTCVACLKSRPFSLACSSCAGLPAGQQAACYRCAAAARTPSAVCADCLSGVVVADQQQQASCLACAMSKRTSAEGKQWCAGCQNWCSDAAGRAKCVDCLASKKQDGAAYGSACGCSSCSG